jgi:hypothetical protein
MVEVRHYGEKRCATGKKLKFGYGIFLDFCVFLFSFQYASCYVLCDVKLHFQLKKRKE